MINQHSGQWPCRVGEIYDDSLTLWVMEINEDYNKIMYMLSKVDS